MTTATKSAAPAKAFRFDTSTIEWKNFLTEGCYYRILDVNVAARTAEMLVKFDPGARCLNHRHVATTMSLVLEGELHVIEKTPAGEKRSVKPAGTFSSGATDEIHIEGGGDDGVVVYFSMRGETDRVYDLLEDDLKLKRAITIHDFHHDWQNWSGVQG
jgi:quercetin dioxygenase-like cupin family protein